MGLCAEQAKSLFNYDAETGELTWKVSPNNRVKRGSIAGSFDKRGYRKITINYKHYRAHHIVWLIIHGCFPKHEIDHINHIKDDNRISNLREATRKQNGRNLSKSSRNKSGIIGVQKRKENNKWRAQIFVNGKCIFLGEFNSKEDAIRARIEANKKYGFHFNHGVNAPFGAGTSAGP